MPGILRLPHPPHQTASRGRSRQAAMGSPENPSTPRPRPGWRRDPSFPGRSPSSPGSSPKRGTRPADRRSGQRTVGRGSWVRSFPPSSWTARATVQEMQETLGNGTAAQTRGSPSPSACFLRSHGEFAESVIARRRLRTHAGGMARAVAAMAGALLRRVHRGVGDPGSGFLGAPAGASELGARRAARAGSGDG